MSDFKVNIRDEGIAATLTRVAHGCRAPRPLMRAIAGLFESETEANFAAQGRPRWLGLAPATIRARQRKGTWPGKILQVSSGGLAASIATDYGDDFVLVGSNKPYAAIQHAGGQAGRGKKVTIPARPYLPADKDGNLQPTTADGIERLANDYLASLVGPQRR